MADPHRLFSTKRLQSFAPFSHAALSRTGLAFVSGRVGQARDTGELVGADLRPQGGSHVR